MASAGPTPIRVFLIEGYPILQFGLESLVKTREVEIQLVGSAATAKDAVEFLGAVSPDLILFDIDPEGPGAIDDEIALLSSSSHAKILVFTGHSEDSVHDRAVMAGASGILQKKVPPATILLAIEKVHART